MTEREIKKGEAKTAAVLSVLVIISATFLGFAVKEIWKVSPIPILIVLGLIVAYFMFYLLFLTKLGQKMIDKFCEEER